MLSNAEQRQFDAIRISLIADPQFAAVSRRAARRLRRHRFWCWLAPLVVARRVERRRARLRAYGA